MIIRKTRVPSRRFREISDAHETAPEAIMSEQYGVVQDDGTIKEYPNQSSAERAGRIEALVVRSHTGSSTWIYPATGCTFHPDDVKGLSAATASQQAYEALQTAHLSRMVVTRRIVSQIHPENEALMVTEMNVLKREGWENKAERMRLALAGMSGAVEALISGQEPFYNYFFLTVFRRRYST